MRVLITISRTWTNSEPVHRWLDMLATQYGSLTVVQGAAKKGDAIAANWAADAKRRGLPVVDEPHPADWDKHGIGAGLIRNEEMVNDGADICLAFIDECRKPPSKCKRRPRPHGSHGATHCADLAEDAGIETRRFTWRTHSPK
jgi:hypothetical protein